MGNPRKKYLVYLFLAIGLVGILLPIGAYQTKNLLKRALADQVVLVNQTQSLRLTYENIEISFLNKSFRLTNVLLAPERLGEENGIRPYTAITSLSVANFQVLPLLFGKRLELDEVLVDGFRVVYKTGAFTKEEGFKVSDENTAINKKVLNSISIAKFKVEGYQIVHLNAAAKDTLETLTGELLSIKNIVLSKDERQEGALSLSYDTTVLELKNQTLLFGAAKERISIATIYLDLGKGYGSIQDFVLGDKSKLRDLAANKKDNKPVNAFRIPKIELFGVAMPQLLERAHFIADSLVVRNAEFTILKNADKPWDKGRMVPMPHDMLRNAKLDFWMHNLRVHNASLDYIEVLGDDQIQIPLRNINTAVTNLGTLEDGYDALSKARAHIDFKATVFKDIDVVVDLKLLDLMNGNQFSFTGSTGPFTFQSFNPILVPTSSIKFESGTVGKIEFSGKGNHESSQGEMIMYYNDLEAVVLKKDMGSQNKVFSFLANNAVRRENPRNGKLMTAKMNYTRRTYKGFPNYLVKTIESGLMNSVFPLGKRKRAAVD